MKKENLPSEEGSDSQKNKCKFTARREAQLEHMQCQNTRSMASEWMVAFCHHCRTYGDFYFMENGEAIPEDYLRQECGLCGRTMKTMVIGFDHIRSLTWREAREAPEAASPQVEFEFKFEPGNN